MQYDIIFLLGETFFDHPLCGVAILKRLLEKEGYTVAIIEKPLKKEAITKYGTPRLFFGISSGAIDSMVRNYTPLKKKRSEDEYLDYQEVVPDRAVLVYSNWVKELFPESVIVLGGTEASLRRFIHYDYWQNRLRKSILFDTRADLLVFGNGEKQILEIAARIKKKENLSGIEGTCLISRELSPGFKELPSEEEVNNSKEKFCAMQLLLNNNHNLAQKSGKRYILQYQSPLYTSADLDRYYELEYTRVIPVKHLRGFEFSVVTHRGCLGNCNFCALQLIQGDKIISRSEASIMREIKNLTKLPYFKGNVDDLGGPSANMYGMDCQRCQNSCLECPKLDRSNQRLIALLKKARKIPGIKNVYLRSGIRYDLASEEYLQEIVAHHLYDTLRIAPEHVNKKVLKLMNKDNGDLQNFIKLFNNLNKSLKCNKKLSFYFITAHPGSSLKEAEELEKYLQTLDPQQISLQVFTPTPLTVSTCMYYTGLDPFTQEKIHVPYTYKEKKEQKRIVEKKVVRKDVKKK